MYMYVSLRHILDCYHSGFIVISKNKDFSLYYCYIIENILCLWLWFYLYVWLFVCVCECVCVCVSVFGALQSLWLRHIDVKTKSKGCLVANRRGVGAKEEKEFNDKMNRNASHSPKLFCFAFFKYFLYTNIRKNANTSPTLLWLKLFFTIFTTL